MKRLQTSIGEFTGPSAIEFIGAKCGSSCGPNTNTVKAAEFLMERFNILNAHKGELNVHALAPLLEVGEFNTIIAEENLEEQSFENSGDFARALSKAVEESKKSDKFPIVLGGDHSCAVGTWSGISNAVDAPIGMVWIDAHMDSHTAESSHTGAIHGMPFAALMGKGHEQLTNKELRVHGQAVDPQYTTIIGVRSYEPEEKAHLEELGVNIVYMEDLYEYKPEESPWIEAFERAAKCPAGFGISLDLDALDPADMPQVACYVPNGLTAEGLLQALFEDLTLEHREKLLALEVVEFAPEIFHNNEREHNARTEMYGEEYANNIKDRIENKMTFDDLLFTLVSAATYIPHRETFKKVEKEETPA